MIRLIWLVLVAWCVSACGTAKGGGAQSLDCAWIESDGNCWKAALATASTCLPDADASGTLSPDGMTCAYPDGLTVAFADAVSFPVSSTRLWTFAVSSGGQVCLRVEESDASTIKLTTRLGVVTASSANGAYAITCPDGTTYSNPLAVNLYSCGTFEHVPGEVSSYSDASVGFALNGGPSGRVPVYNCIKP